MSDTNESILDRMLDHKDLWNFDDDTEQQDALDKVLNAEIRIKEIPIRIIQEGNEIQLKTIEQQIKEKQIEADCGSKIAQIEADTKLQIADMDNRHKANILRMETDAKALILKIETENSARLAKIEALHKEELAKIPHRWKYNLIWIVLIIVLLMHDQNWYSLFTKIINSIP